MQHSVKVRSIPTDLQIPEDLKQKIRFDPTEKQIVFRGFMCKADYDRLVALSSDSAYQTGIARLFQVSSEAPQLRRFRRVLTVLTVACFLLAAVAWWILLGIPAFHASGFTP